MEQTGSQKALDKEEQTQIMEKMELPDILKTSLMENNTAETYRYLAVSTFAEYIADSLAVMIVNGISFLLSFIISAIVIRLLSYILNVLTNLPVIKGVNKIAWGVVGGAKCIIFIWIGFLILTLLCDTTIGKQGMALVEQDTVLNFLYNQNIFVKVFMSVFYGNWAQMSNNVKKSKKLKKGVDEWQLWWYTESRFWGSGISFWKTSKVF